MDSIWESSAETGQMSRSAQLVGVLGTLTAPIASCVFQTWRRANHPSIANKTSRLPAGRRDGNWSKRRIRFRGWICGWLGNQQQSGQKVQWYLVGVAGFEPATPASRTLASVENPTDFQSFAQQIAGDYLGLFTVFRWLSGDWRFRQAHHH